MSYVKFYDNGEIQFASKTPFDGALLVNYDTVAVNGKIYKKGTEPAKPSATDMLFARLRAARDVRLTATDKYLLPDYPVSADNLALVKAYRAALRALPEQTGAPWDGGDEGTPWPQEPKV